MKYRKMGRTGLMVSELSLGCMNFGNQTKEEDAVKIVQRAHELGINHFDTAKIYPIGGSGSGISEGILGRAIKTFRHDIIITTKTEGLSRKEIMESVEGSLKQLETDYIDIYLAHGREPKTPMDETLRAFDDLVHSGKVRYTGCSNHHTWEIAKSLWISDKHNLARFDCIQFRYNLLSRMPEWDTIPFCNSERIGLFVYNPLAGGLLAGGIYAQGEKQVTAYTPGSPRPKIGRFVSDGYTHRYWNERNLEAVQQLRDIANKFGHTPIQMALAWLISNKNITSLLSLVDYPDQINQNAAAIEITLSEQEIAECNEIYESMLPTGWLDVEVGKERFSLDPPEFAY
jgi:aryl-alcohol dehydrogenase (NADP+)